MLQDLDLWTEVRRRVLGEDHVGQSYAVDALSRPKTQLSEYVWSTIWARPGLTLGEVVAKH